MVIEINYQTMTREAFRDKVNVTFLREEHTCSRYGLLNALKHFRESIA